MKTVVVRSRRLRHAGTLAFFCFAAVLGCTAFWREVSVSHPQRGLHPELKVQTDASVHDENLEQVALSMPAESRGDFKLLSGIIDMEASIAALSLFPVVVGHVRDYLSRLKLEQQKDNRCVFLDWAPTKDVFGLALALAFPQCLTISQKGDDGYGHIQQAAASLQKGYNFVLCNQLFAYRHVASLEITSTVLDFQFLLGPFYADNVALTSGADLELFLRGLVQLAAVTIIQVPATWAPLLQPWSASPHSAIASIFEGTPGVAVDDLLAHHTGAPLGVDHGTVLVVSNTAAKTFGRHASRPLCEHVWTLLECKVPLEAADCQVGDMQGLSAHRTLSTQRRAVRGDGDIADQQSPRPPVHHALLKIPADACDAYKRTAGLHVRPEAVAKCSVHAPTSAAAALFENNGYFKCRNESHWASPCLRIDRRHD
eukprot:m.323469 g.323469  ORF g.323469 m.323469 type:complete len:427 (-) comp20358_c0_seq40:2401-3681(-)